MSTGFFVHDKNEDTYASEYESYHQTKRIQECRQYLQLPTEKPNCRLFQIPCPHYFCTYLLLRCAITGEVREIAP